MRNLAIWGITLFILSTVIILENKDIYAEDIIQVPDGTSYNPTTIPPNTNSPTQTMLTRSPTSSYNPTSTPDTNSPTRSFFPSNIPTPNST